MLRSESRGPSKSVWLWTLYAAVLLVIAVALVAALTVISPKLEHLHLQWLPGLGWGASGGLAYALRDALADFREGFPEGHRWAPDLMEVAVRAILGAIVGAATLALGDASAFVAGLAGAAALVALGAKFGRRKPRSNG